MGITVSHSQGRFSLCLHDHRHTQNTWYFTFLATTCSAFDINMPNEVWFGDLACILNNFSYVTAHLKREDLKRKIKDIESTHLVYMKKKVYGLYEENRKGCMKE